MNKLRDALARQMAARDIHYGWVMVAVAFLYSVFSSSAMGVPSVLIILMSKELGWSNGELSSPQGLRLALFGLTAPFAGGLMLRYGPTRMVMASGVLLSWAWRWRPAPPRSGSCGWAWASCWALRRA